MFEQKGKIMNKFRNITQIPLRWLIHGIFLQRTFQLFAPRYVASKLNTQAEQEFDRLSNNLLNSSAREPKIIVSLTTTPRRFGKIMLVVSRMMNQTVKPDRIIVYCDESQKQQFVINDDLKKLMNLGLEIMFVKDIGPHTKYFYALQDFKDDIVITVDDDIIYSHQLIERLMASYQNYPKLISANIVTNFFFDHGELAPSIKWRQKFTYGVGDEHSIAYGVGGVLYPPHVMPDETFDEAKIRKFCLYADDLWLKAVENKHGVSVVKTNGGDKLFKYFVTVDGSQAISLRSENDEHDRNVRYLEKLLDEYWECL